MYPKTLKSALQNAVGVFLNESTAVGNLPHDKKQESTTDVALTGMKSALQKERRRIN